MAGSCLLPHPTASCRDHGHQPVPKPSCPLADVTDPNSIKAAVRKVQAEVGSAGLNLLINNSGTTRRSTLATETAENMSLVYTTNTIGPLQTSQVRRTQQPLPQTRGTGRRRMGMPEVLSPAGLPAPAEEGS